MEIYEIRFMKSGSPVRTKDHSSEIHCGTDRFFAKEEDLEMLKKYGDGFKKVEYVGELFEDSLVVDNTTYLIKKFSNITESTVDHGRAIGISLKNIDLNTVVGKINDFLEPNGIRFVIEEKDGKYSHYALLDGLLGCWNKLSKVEKVHIAKLLFE